MENFKIPFVTEAQSERKKHAESYLCNLNQRLQELNQQHDEILEKSISIMQEINQVTINLDLASLNLKCFENGIKNSRSELETFASQNGNTELKNIFQTTEELLKESLSVLKNTKGSLENFESFLNEVVKDSNSKETVAAKRKDMPKPKRLKLEDLSHFSSGCSSRNSLIASPLEEVATLLAKDTFYDTTFSTTDVGYQGDIENSDYNLIGRKEGKGD